MVWNPQAEHVRRVARKRQMRLARSPHPGPGGEEKWALLNWNGTIIFGGGGPKPWGYSASLDEVEQYLSQAVQQD